MSQNTPADVTMMPYVPLKPAWLQALGAYHSSDARLVRAALSMLVYAWHEVPAGTLSASAESLAKITGLKEAEVIEQQKVLFSGWTLAQPKKSAEATITFEPLSEMARGLHSAYKDELVRLQQASLVAMAAPDLFKSELLPVQGADLRGEVGEATASQVPERTAVARKLPDGAPLTNFARDALAKRGFTITRHGDIWQRFCDYHIARGERSDSWDRQFRYWLDNQIRYGSLVPDEAHPQVSVPLSAKAQPVRTVATPRFVPTPGARGDAIHAKAKDSLARAAAMMVRPVPRSTRPAPTPVGEQKERAS